VLQVALLFLLQDQLANEAAWRTFFTAASQLQLQPAVAAAAAKAAEQLKHTTLADAIGQHTALHPELQRYPSWMYPGYRAQHGLSWADVQAAAARQASSSSQGPMPGPANQKEQQPEASFSHNNSSVNSSGSSDSGRRGSSGADGTPAAQWLQQVYQQPSTLQDAVAVATARGLNHLSAQSLPRAAGSNSTATDPMLLQQLAVLTDADCCAANTHRYTPVAAGTAGAHQHPQHIQQQLFSVYVHTPAGVLLPQDSVLSGCELATRLNTTNGYAQHVLAEAAALLLVAALADPLNAKFVLVSDTSIPLYPPQVTSMDSCLC
jgi:hypothetical protein